MNSFEKIVRGQGGTLRKFKNYALNVKIPIIQEITRSAEKEYGKENLVVHSAVTADKELEISIFRKDSILAEAKRIAGQCGLEVEILEETFSVGVGGDIRTYTPVINVSGPFPVHDVLEKVSNEITNTLPINRVTYEPK